jgi:hypothetical protein
MDFWAILDSLAILAVANTAPLVANLVAKKFWAHASAIQSTVA